MKIFSTTNVILLILLCSMTACAGTKYQKIEIVKQVDLNRFMGKWYVIACIPTYIDKDAYNATETYSLNVDGTIDTTFVFNKGNFSGPQKKYNPKGFVVKGSNNARWGMRFIWPIKAEYLITELNSDYTQTIIARNKRDYVWIMARTPKISEADYQEHVKRIKELGYDLSKLRKIPHLPL